ncbi:MAG: hypothetical protein ACN4GW_15085 [Desulforhopalus sp.]
MDANNRKIIRMGISSCLLGNKERIQLLPLEEMRLHDTVACLKPGSLTPHSNELKLQNHA